MILAGEAMPEVRVAVYSRLIAGGAIPAVQPLPDESAVAFLKRSVATIDAGAFAAHFGEHEGYDMETIPDLGSERLIVSFEANTERMMHCDIEAFDSALCAHDARLAGALIREIEAASSALNAIGPSSAWDLAWQGDYYDDFGCWWEEVRAQVEYEKRESLGKKAKKAKVSVSNTEVRKFIRESGMRTPGSLRNAIGRHYCTDRGHNRPELELRISALPAGPRVAALAVFEITKRMKSATASLRRVMTQTDSLVLSDLSYFTHPALILDHGRGGEQSLVYEILEERYQLDVQDKGWGPGFAIVLEDSPKAVRRFMRALQALRDLSSAARDLCEAMRGFSMLTAEGK